MPSSRAISIPTVIHLLRQLKPRSILDIGVGFGKWGHLFREYTDILEAERDPSRYERKNWQVQIDGVEGYEPYITEMHRYIYNEIYIGNASDVIPRLGPYDMVYMGDIIEHVEKEKGIQLLEQVLQKTNKALIVSTPRFETYQDDLCGNELERHRSLWTPRDFKRFPSSMVTNIGGSLLLAVLVKPGVPMPSFKSAPLAKPEDVNRLEQARRTLAEKIPNTERFVLVDEEQIRSSLSHAEIIPFLEKHGIWWGAPPDDATAIDELTRMRSRGVKYMAFIWSTFWWLDHYRGFKSVLEQVATVHYEGPEARIYRL